MCAYKHLARMQGRRENAIKGVYKMIKKINLHEFRNEFKEIRPNNFSYEGLEVLFDYLEEFEDFELDVIGLCCDFTECTIDEALNNYNLESIEELENNTVVLHVNNETIIYQNY
jgi:hypothetical protein